MAVDYLSSLNIGSGLNTTEIIDALAEAERAPKASEITTAKEKRTVEISSLGQVKQGFETLDNSLSASRKSRDCQRRQAEVPWMLELTDAKIASKFDHSIAIISSVAAGQTLGFRRLFQETDVHWHRFTLTFSFGTWNSDNSFTANSRQERRHGRTGNRRRAHFAGPTRCCKFGEHECHGLHSQDWQFDLCTCAEGQRGRGACNAITAAEDAGAAGLNNFAYTTPNNSVQTIAASDAAFTMDGVNVTRESNEDH